MAGAIAISPPGSNTRYAYGIACTWHGSIHSAARSKPRIVDGASVSYPCCPNCGSLLAEAPGAEVWYAEVRRMTTPEYETMLRWGQGRCFPDNETLQNAYRQAMEE